MTVRSDDNRDSRISTAIDTSRFVESLFLSEHPHTDQTPLTGQHVGVSSWHAVGTHYGFWWFIAHPACGSTTNLSEARTARLRSCGLAIGLSASSADQ